MTEENTRVCAACSQPIPPKAKLAGVRVGSSQLALLRGGDAADQPDSAEICLACRIELAEREKGR